MARNNGAGSGEPNHMPGEPNREQLIAIAADYLMQPGDTEATRQQLRAWLSDPANAHLLEQVRVELLLEERISGSFDLSNSASLSSYESAVGSQGSAQMPHPPMPTRRRPNALRRGIANALRWNARRLER